jgi:hypothetical protein
MECLKFPRLTIVYVHVILSEKHYFKHVHQVATGPVDSLGLCLLSSYLIWFNICPGQRCSSLDNKLHSCLKFICISSDIPHNYCIEEGSIIKPLTDEKTEAPGRCLIQSHLPCKL